MKLIEIKTDGGARGNPGPAGAGFVITTASDEVLHEGSKALGIATNNQAEYWALILSLEWLKDNLDEEARLEFKLDSKLIVEQLKGNYKVKNEGLKPLFERASKLLAHINPPKYTFTHIPRRQNKRADELANIAMDRAKK